MDLSSISASLQSIQGQSGGNFASSMVDLAKQGASIGQDFTNTLQSKIGANNSLLDLSVNKPVTNASSFQKIGAQFLENANQTVLQSEIEQRKFLVGESSIQQVAIATKEAELTLSLTANIAQKLQEAYKTIVQIQV